MKISRLLLIATGIEAIAAASVLLLAGAAAGLPFHPIVAGTLDFLNQFTPLLLALLLAGVLLTAIVMEKRPARTRFLILAAVAGLASSPPLAAEYAARIRIDHLSPPPARTDLRLLQFNVLETNVNPAKAISQIVGSGADIVTIQEPHPVIRTSSDIARAYPHKALAVRPSCSTGCMTLILSKRPIAASGSLVLWMRQDRVSTPGLDLQVQWADTTAPDGRPVRVMTTHFVWPIPPHLQAQQRRALAAFVRRQELRELILTGDFNSSPWSYGIRRQDADFAPMSRRTRAVYSWPAYVPRLWRPTMMTFLAIDHVYAGPAWKTVALARGGRGGSDHYPVLVTLRRKGS